ncbi:hypothetical protein MLD38_001419 [Melastoma candidum]|uniref:Uncharacterized protein n=1 Tax=Melastoma candidum TaxID=119954 RepID=A0ACB9SI39_9MYRT|nr:hypothetical protein MLD38_001419 [Melastoma candidum]
MAHSGAIEVAKTVLEVADVAWTAVEIHQHHHRDDADGDRPKGTTSGVAGGAEKDEVEALRSENGKLRNLLEQNLKLLRNLSDASCLINDCPPDLYARLVGAVDSDDFLDRIEELQHASSDGVGTGFPFREATGADIHSAEILVNTSQEDPSWWVWVTDDMFPNNVEEWSGIDDEKYVVIGEEHVVDGVANFMARCILANPKAQRMTPKELQKTLKKALGEVSMLGKMMDIWHAGKIFYAFSTWGLALAGLYRGRIIWKLATLTLRTSKVALRAL